MTKTGIGQRLKELRLEHGYSQADVAKILGIGRTTYLKYESEENRPTRKLDELCNLYGVTADYLLGREGNAEQEEREAARRASGQGRQLEKILQDDGLTYKGHPITDEDREKIESVLEIVIGNPKEKTPATQGGTSSTWTSGSATGGKKLA